MTNHNTEVSSPVRKFNPVLLRQVVTVIVLTVICLIWIYPFLWMVSASFKSSQEIFVSGLNLVPETLRWENYVRAWNDVNFGRYMINTVVVTFGTVALVVFITSLTGYVLGRHSFWGKRPLIAVIAVTIFVPAGYTIIPIVQLSKNLGLLNSLLGIILALSGTGNIAAILLFAGFFRQIPNELEEAAVLDGASFPTVFWRIMFPLATPVITTVSVITFLGAWNNFFIPLVFTFGNPNLRTLSVGMYSFIGQYETDWSGMAAAATISLIPIIILFFIMQRYYIEGIAGAVKS